MVVSRALFSLACSCWRCWHLRACVVTQLAVAVPQVIGNTVSQRAC
jgi:hypothetical protein